MRRVPPDGPLARYGAGRSPTPREVRPMLVVGGLGIYVLFAVHAFPVAAS